MLEVIAAATYKSLPIAYVFAPIRYWPGFYFLLVTLGSAGAVRLAGYLDLLGQRPITWAVLLGLIYLGGHRRLPTPQSMKRVYSFSRRFDLATVFIAVALWAVALTLCRILNSQWLETAYFSFLLLVVALAQFLFSPLGRPRTVSVVAGMVYAVVGALVLSFLPFGLILHLIPALMWGAFFGYIAGVCIAAAPLISDLIRSTARRGSSRENSTESD